VGSITSTYGGRPERIGRISRRHRHAAERFEGLEQPAHQGFLALVGYDGDVHEATPLEPAREEVYALHRARREAHAHHPEVVLTELPGDAPKRTSGATDTGRTRRISS
jgi:hypothetical protein